MNEDRKFHDRLLSLVHTVPGAIYQGHRDWSISFIGAAVMELTGYAPEEFRGGAILWKEIIHPDDRESVKETLRKAARERGGALRLEYRILRKDGGVRWVADRRRMIYDERGSLAHVDGLLIDITERKETDRRLAESEHRFRTIMHTAPDGVVIVDADGNIVLFNPAAQRLFGYTADEIAGRSVETIIPERYVSAHRAGLNRFRETGEARILGRTVELEALRKDGSEFPIELSLGSWQTHGDRFFSAFVRDITERQAEGKVLTRLALAVDQAAEAVVITDTEGTLEYANPSFERITGYSREEAIGRNLRIVKSGKHDPSFYRAMWEALSSGEVWRGRFINRRKDGTLYDEEDTISPVRDAAGKIVGFVAGKRDITREVVLQKQVQTAQRMESVGTLAGGIAHDFNNALTGILGYGEMLRERIAQDPEALRDLEMIGKCAEQAATLTRQLLAFARRQRIEPVNLDINVVVTDLLKLLRKVIGEHIEIRTFLSRDLPVARADRGQLEQVVMNLCLNARDAMAAGGMLQVETSEVTLDEEYRTLHPYVNPGRYVMLRVSDTGIGMDEDTRERIFEPFFTTKPVDKGTGLGLSVVYGIVKRHGGHMHVYSEPGKGSTFKVYLRAVDAPPDAIPAKSPEREIAGGTETILLAEDEEAIRVLSERALTELGYRVVAARNGAEAVDILRRNPDIDLAVLDVVMPRMGGKEAWEEMRRIAPNLKVIFMSGYSAEAIHESYVLSPRVPFLPKPFSPTSLARKVREVLDAPGP